jgi:ubiquitin-protein ligase
MSRKERIKQEIKEFNEWKGTINCEGNHQEYDPVWNVTLGGPIDSPYVGGKFKIRITLPEGYPNSKPTFEFLTDICHINIKGKQICLDSLNDKTYNPDYSIMQILTQIFMMLTSPNEDSPLNWDYYQLYSKDIDAYFEKAREMTRQFAK